MRGIDSIANAVTPRAVSRSMPSASVSGCRWPIRTCPSRRRSTSSALGLRTLATRSASQGSPRVAPALAEGVVREGGSFSGAGLDDDVEAGLRELGDDLRHECHAALVRRRFLGHPDLHRGGTLRGREPASGLEQSKSVACLTALSAAIEERDPFARGHASRVAVLAHSLARRADFDRERIARLRTGAVLHDIGKLAVPREVLLKEGPLDEIEFMQIRRHPAAGARMLRAVGAALEALPCVLFHHERWDGAGYPSGRAGDDIPLEARILAVADSFDAMTSTARTARRAPPRPRSRSCSAARGRSSTPSSSRRSSRRATRAISAGTRPSLRSPPRRRALPGSAHRPVRRQSVAQTSSFGSSSAR